MIVEGTLDEYSEQGWEGHFELTLCEDGRSGLDGLVWLAPGDRLTVWDASGTVVFQGPLPSWTGRWRWLFFRVEPKLPPGFFDWFRVHHYRARLERPDP